MLLIIGIMTGYLTSSLVTLLSSISSAQSIQGYVIWGMGTFSGVSLTQLPLFSILTIIGLVCSALLSKPLNILLLGDNYARNLGVNVVTVRNLLLLVTGILTAVITAYCGPVAFIGLAIPHVARMIWRTDNHWVLMPGTMLCGAAVALACNLISVLPQSNIIPINALTPLVGVPVIIYVIVKRGR
jgi:iron complex transport system permease protein